MTYDKTANTITYDKKLTEETVVNCNINPIAPTVPPEERYK